MMKNISQIRQDYKLSKLNDDNISSDPFALFDTFFAEVLGNKIEEPNAMILSTCVNNRPSSRVVLLKGYDIDGFVFFTNYESKKSKELAQNPHSSLLFFWKELQKQIRIEGIVEKIDDNISQEYFNTRPYESQIGAWASPQSKKIDNRKILEDNLEYFKTLYPNHLKKIPKPENWGGYVLKPEYFEFWQGRAYRLHDRITFEKSSKKNIWHKCRIAP